MRYKTLTATNTLTRLLISFSLSGADRAVAWKHTTQLNIYSHTIQHSTLYQTMRTLTKCKHSKQLHAQDTVNNSLLPLSTDLNHGWRLHICQLLHAPLPAHDVTHLHATIIKIMITSNHANFSPNNVTSNNNSPQVAGRCASAPGPLAGTADAGTYTNSAVSSDPLVLSTWCYDNAHLTIRCDLHP